MPALAFGLKGAKPVQSITKSAPKRKAIFDEDPEDDDDNDAFAGLQKSKSTKAQSKSINNQGSEQSRKSPKLTGPSLNSTSSARYTNLSALRSAKLQDEDASKVDASVYDYDAVYETFHAPKDKKKDEEEASGPKYMTSLLQSAEVRKRDQLRAKEKLLQKERDAEGDEFADKDKFVTGAYKKQLEENRRLEEEEKKRVEEEEEKRRKGGGMTEFNRSLLQKEEQRQKDIQEAAEEAKRRKEAGEDNNAVQDDLDVDENKMAAQLNREGAKIVVNDEGEVVDKRQLLGAGLNVAPKKPDTITQSKKAAQAAKPQEWRRSEKAQDARMSQRERQTRMVERQIEELAEKQREAEKAEQEKLEEKNKSKLTEESKMSAKERYLQRKKEREDQAKKDKSGG